MAIASCGLHPARANFPTPPRLSSGWTLRGVSKILRSETEPFPALEYGLNRPTDLKPASLHLPSQLHNFMHFNVYSLKCFFLVLWLQYPQGHALSKLLDSADWLPTSFSPRHLVSTGLPDLLCNVRVAFPDDGTQQDSPEGQHRQPKVRRHAGVLHCDTG